VREGTTRPDGLSHGVRQTPGFRR